MKQRMAETVGDIIDNLLKLENLDVKLDEQRICAVWQEVVGPGIYRYTISIPVYNKFFY